MKALFTSTLLLLFFLPTHAQNGVKWMSWNEAVAANKEEPKLIFVDTYTDWCGWCKKMDATTFSHPVIADYMNEHYYAVKMDAEMKDTINFNGYTFVNPRPDARRSTHQLAASLLDNKLSYPSFIFLNQNFERMQILPGYKTAKQFEPIIRYFVEGASNGVQYEDYMKDFSSLIGSANAN
jgi:thioredoxin-related protein